MTNVPPEILARFDARLAREPVPEQLYSFYRRWLRFYFDFCHKYQHDPANRESLSPFLAKLAEKKQASQFRKQAAHAISLFYEDMPSATVPSASNPTPPQPRAPANTEPLHSTVVTDNYQKNKWGQVWKISFSCRHDLHLWGTLSRRMQKSPLTQSGQHTKKAAHGQIISRSGLRFPDC